jgi:hypothetical protein
VAIELNEVGDVVLDEAAIRVLSGEGSYFLLERLRKAGSATAAELGAETSDLVELADVGLVTGPDEAHRWHAVGRGLFLQIPSDPESQTSARQLVGIMLLDGADAPRRWVETKMSQLDANWFAAAGRLSVGVMLTAQELEEIQAAFETILEPYVNRPSDTDTGLRHVHILSYFLPSPDLTPGA